VACDPSLDYQSSPNLHPIFGACVAMQLAQMWRSLDCPARFDVFEAGAGNGRLAADVVKWIQTREPELFDALRYQIQDRTYPGRSDSAVEALGLPRDKVVALQNLPGEGEIEGCMLSNELLDAFPVHRVRLEGGHLFELRVGLESGVSAQAPSFVDVAGEPSGEVVRYFEDLGLLPGEGCEAEVNLEAPRWVARAAAALRRGYVLTFDYGYEAPELFAPWRRRGTLLTFYRHTSGEDPYRRVGRQDITASVDFTTVMRAGQEAGLQTLSLTTQSEFLSGIGIGEALAERPPPDQLEAYYGLRRSVIELTDTTGLGRIKVLVQGKDAPPSVAG
jgi:SAM-dependent MidA family methyltransferase